MDTLIIYNDMLILFYHNFTGYMHAIVTVVLSEGLLAVECSHLIIIITRKAFTPA